jgi:8-oxo-dGTP diphosphatase
MSLKTFELSVTAIIEKDGKFLVTRRSPNKKRYPGLWTVPGGHVEKQDYESVLHNEDNVAYNVIENTLRREVREEVGLFIDNIRYVTNMELSNGEVIVLSFLASYAGGAVKLDPSECDEHAWVTVPEAENIRLISGILDELKLAEKILNV